MCGGLLGGGKTPALPAAPTPPPAAPTADTQGVADARSAALARQRAASGLSSTILTQPQDASTTPANSITRKALLGQ